MSVFIWRGEEFFTCEPMRPYCGPYRPRRRRHKYQDGWLVNIWLAGNGPPNAPNITTVGSTRSSLKIGEKRSYECCPPSSSIAAAGSNNVTIASFSQNNLSSDQPNVINVAAPADGLYLFSGYANTDSPASASTSPAGQLTWTDADNAENASSLFAIDLTNKNDPQTVAWYFWCAAGESIGFSYTGGDYSGGATYQLNVTVQQIMSATAPASYAPACRKTLEASYLMLPIETDIWGGDCSCEGDLVEVPAWSGRLFRVKEVQDTCCRKKGCDQPPDTRVAVIVPWKRMGYAPGYSPYYDPIGYNPYTDCYNPWKPGHSPYDQNQCYSPTAWVPPWGYGPYNPITGGYAPTSSPNVLQHGQGGTLGGSSYDFAWPVTTSNSSLLIYFVSSESPVSTPAGLTLIASQSTANTFSGGNIYLYCFSAAAASPTASQAFGYSGVIDVLGFEVSATAVDVTSASSGTGTLASLGPTAATAVNGELALAVALADNSVGRSTATNGFTGIDDLSIGFIGVSSYGNVIPTMATVSTGIALSASADWCGIIVTCR